MISSNHANSDNQDAPWDSTAKPFPQKSNKVFFSDTARVTMK
jgi:hypothetical protein